MKKLQCIMLSLLLAIGFASNACAETIRIDFTYDNQGYEELNPVAYRIYLNGDELCTSDAVVVDPETGRMNYACDTSFEAYGDNQFSMAAVFDDGSVSGQSNVVTLNIPRPVPEPLAPRIVGVTIERDGNIIAVYIETTP